MKSKATAMVTAALLVMGIAGCTKYYQVKDPQSGMTYFTNDIDEKSSGAVRFEDAGSGSIVTLQNSEVKRIGKKEFQSGKAQPRESSVPQTAAPVPEETTAAPTP